MSMFEGIAIPEQEFAEGAIRLLVAKTRYAMKVRLAPNGREIGGIPADVRVSVRDEPSVSSGGIIWRRIAGFEQINPQAKDKLRSVWIDREGWVAERQGRVIYLVMLNLM